MDIKTASLRTGSVPHPPMRHKVIPNRAKQPSEVTESFPTGMANKPLSFKKEAMHSANRKFSVPSGLQGPIVSAQFVSPIPNPNSPLESNVPWPGPGNSSSENKTPELPWFQSPTEAEGEDVLPRALDYFVVQDTPSEARKSSTTTISAIQKGITISYNNDGFLDDGYVVELDENGDPAQLGEATLFTAIAVIALAAGNYKQDVWEIEEANNAIGGFLTVLQEKSWGTTDFLFEGETSSGEKHPIRHPRIFEWDKAGRKRNRPLSKDSFGAIVAACYYAFNCPNSSEEVRRQAQKLLTQWIDYLSKHKWMMHTNWADKQLEEVTFSGPELQATNQKLTIEAFMLWPHELYALKNCAISLSVPHSIIVPYLDTILELGNVLGTALENFVTMLSHSFAEALEHILDLLNYSKAYDFELIPGWRRSALKGRLTVAIDSGLKKVILRSFEAACKANFMTNVSIFRETGSLALQFGTIVTKTIEQILGLFPAVLKHFPLLSFIQDMFKQMLPWFDVEMLAEFYAFMVLLVYALMAKDSDIGYNVWSFATLLECRPALVYWLLPAAASIFETISNRGNPNGIWAWLAHKRNIVDQQLSVFENNHINYWKYYAYTKKYDDWIHEDVNTAPGKHGPASPRLDYLVLQGLAEKGPPRAATKVKVDLKMLWDGFQSCIQALIDEAVSSFTTLGWYQREFIDLAGYAVEETVDVVEGFTRNIWKDGKQTSRLVHHIAGEVQYTRWDAVGALNHYMRWVKAQSDLSLSSADLVEFQLRDVLAGSEKMWKWTNGVLSSFVKYSLTPVSGTAADLLNWTLQQERSLEGKLEQWVNSSGTLLSYTVWSNSSVDGLAEAGNMIVHKVRDPSGPLRQWIYEPGVGLKSFTIWANSTTDLEADAAQMATQTVRNATGLLTIVEKEGERFIRQLVFSSSTSEGLAKSSECVLYQVRSLDAKIEQWEFDAGVPKTYRVWGNSTLSGIGSGSDLVKSVERSDGGKFIVRNYKSGVQYSGQIVDRVGHELEKIGGDIQHGVEDTTKAIGKLIHGLHI